MAGELFLSSLRANNRPMTAENVPRLIIWTNDCRECSQADKQTNGWLGCSQTDDLGCKMVCVVRGEQNTGSS